MPRRLSRYTRLVSGDSPELLLLTWLNERVVLLLLSGLLPVSCKLLRLSYHYYHVPHRLYSPLPWFGTYSAAKAATHSIMDTLWMECKPLGINTTLVAGGFIYSKLLGNAANTFQLPDNTLYSSMKDTVYNIFRVADSSWATIMATEDFADKVAKETVKKNPPRFMCIGGHSFWFKLFLWFPRVFGLMALWMRALSK